MDLATNLQIFTPLSTALLITYLLALVSIGLWLWSCRGAIKGYLIARLAESTTQHALNTALTATSVWMTGGVALSSVVPLWMMCFALIIKPEGHSTNPPPAGP